MAQPEKVFKQGCCSASVFVNTIDKDGRQINVRSVSLQRSYKDRDGKWQTTSSYGVNELPKLIMAATKAYDYLTAVEGSE